MCNYVRQRKIEHYSKHYLFVTWRMMNYRCYSPVHTSYQTYGGAGVTVCPDWRWDNPEGFFNFLKDVGERPEGTTLDRVNPYGNYEKSNTRWADKKTQQNNFRQERDTESGYLGIVKECRGRWKVSLQLNNEAVTIGLYTNLGEAKIARDFCRDLKMREGDCAVLDWINRNTEFTPKNKGFYKRKTSKYFGVCWVKGKSKWKAYYNKPIVNGKVKQIHLGYFDTEDKAAKVVMDYLKSVGVI